MSNLTAYHEFLARKAILDPPTGLANVHDLPEAMFAFQRDITSWALRRGRAALFAGTGLGKSFMELAWADAIHRETGKDILHLAPLAVSAQMIREADKFGLAARQVRDASDCLAGVNITNYQKLEHFDLSQFGGVILDESSILKSSSGAFRNMLIEQCGQVPFRLAATATPAPNDFMELGNHAEFLGVMSYTDMLATFFVHDGGDTQSWRLKGHAEDEFWRWMASWAIMLRKPGENPEPISGGFEQFIGTGLDISREAYAKHAAETVSEGRKPWPYEQWASILVWQRYASPVWSDIDQTRTLQYRGGRDEKDEQHISPLQLDVIERCIDLWSAKGDIVLTPFLGIGSEVFCAVKMGRRGVGFELKPSYFAQAVRNLKDAGKACDDTPMLTFAEAS